MGGGYGSSGFEIGNVLDRRTYPQARRGRTGPPPTSQPADFDPNQLRGAPILARPCAFQLRTIGNRALVAFGSFVGPGLIKRLDLTVFSTTFGTDPPVVNLFYDTAPYVTTVNAGLARPHGTQLWETRIADDQPAAFVGEGGLNTLGVQGLNSNYLLDRYVPDTNFYIGLSLYNSGGSAPFVIGSLLVYEGVMVSDFPTILG